MKTDEIEGAIELCLRRAGELDPAQPERHALLGEVVQIRRMAEIFSSHNPEPMNSLVIAPSTRDGLSFDDEVLAVVGRSFRKYDLWCRRSGRGR